MLICFFFISRVLVRHILIDGCLILGVKKRSKQAYNLKVIASVIQTLALLAFADLGRFDGENHFIDANEILQRKTGFKLSTRNDDGLCNLVFAPSDFPDIFELSWS
jgi:hypothetical protein